MGDIIRASCNGNIELLKESLAVEGAAVDLHIVMNALYWASRFGYLEIVKELLAVEGATAAATNFKNLGGAIALIAASSHSHVEIVKVLLSLRGYKKGINLQDSGGNTALIWVASHGSVEIVKLLFRVEGIDVNLSDRGGSTALILAIRFGHVEVAELLLEIKGIDVNLQNALGDTALIWAACKGNIEMAKLLLHVPGIDVNILDKRGDSALMIGVLNFREGATEMIKLLVRAGVRIDTRIIIKCVERTEELGNQLREWSDDSKMLSKLSLQRRCWLAILPRDVDYRSSIPPIIVHILNGIWLQEDSDDPTSIWAQGYIIRMRDQVEK